MIDHKSLASKSRLSLTARLEALLFVAPDAVYPGQLANALDISTRQVEKGLQKLENLYHDRGLRLMWHDGKVQLTTPPEAGDLVERFLKIESTTRLSQAALETLAIVAYKQPVTRPEVDAIRGVNSDGVLRTLLSKGLIEETGRAESPGRPILYCSTSDFLMYFGLSSLEDLPPLEVKDDLNNNDQQDS